jgi:hypothetical protein
MIHSLGLKIVKVCLFEGSTHMPCSSNVNEAPSLSWILSREGRFIIPEKVPAAVTYMRTATSSAVASLRQHMIHCSNCQTVHQCPK